MVKKKKNAIKTLRTVHAKKAKEVLKSKNMRAEWQIF